MSAKALAQQFARRAVTQAKNLKPARGGDHIPYQNKNLPKTHKGAMGAEYGTSYLRVGNSPADKMAIGGGLMVIVGGGVGAVMWSAWRQGQWS
mmetsp:Transcript_48719/g.115029  ORF Transcript_48719/g.115029 Transcript_48719/m.115029 type:complete len:93 (+) Transcript_48719:28-306(+)